MAVFQEASAQNLPLRRPIHKRSNFHALLLLLKRLANRCTLWGELFNRPVYGLVCSGNKRD